MTSAGSSVSDFWWRDFPVGRVAPLDYPLDRIREANARLARGRGRLAAEVGAIVARSRTAEDAVRGIAGWVQSALVHPPLFQPATARWGYWRWRRAGLLPAVVAGHEEIRALLHQRLVMDPELLLELGEGRCGQCAALLVAALRLAGFHAEPWQLPHHIAVQVEIEGETRVIDADAFKNGIFLEENGRLISKRAVAENPHVVDRFKPTGWMFRRDSTYALSSSGRPYRGYVDFYSPEVDGQISVRYAAATRLRPPGVPRWLAGSGPIRANVGQLLDLALVGSFPERARGYRIRCGRRSRGYSYDRLVLSALAGETSDEVAVIERPEPSASIRLTERGRYYLGAAAIPSYLEEFPSYVWWSDELIVDVE